MLCESQRQAIRNRAKEQFRNTPEREPDRRRLYEPDEFKPVARSVDKEDPEAPGAPRIEKISEVLRQSESDTNQRFIQERDKKLINHWISGETASFLMQRYRIAQTTLNRIIANKTTPEQRAARSKLVLSRKDQKPRKTKRNPLNEERQTC